MPAIGGIGAKIQVLFPWKLSNWPSENGQNPTPHTPHPTPCPHEKLFQQTLIKEVQVIEIVSKANKKIKVKIEIKNEEIDKKRQELGRFIWATNIVVDEQKLKPHEILKNIKIN